MVRIRLPEYTDDCRDDAGGGGKADAVCDRPDDVPCDFGSPTLEERHPDVHHVVTPFTLANEQQSAMIHEVDVNGREVEEVVREWMAANEGLRRAWLPGQGPGRVPPLVSGWLPDARRRRYVNVKEYRRCSTTS